MSENEDTEDEPKKKGSKLPLILGLILALVGGGGSFFAVYSGMLLGGDATTDAAPDESMPVAGELPDVAFVEVEPMIITMGRGTASKHLRFRAQLEVPSTQKGAVEALLPRVVDVLNTYLRAVEMSDLNDPAALVRLRAQMLRRLQVVTGPGRVSDLLIMEFVMS